MIIRSFNLMKGYRRTKSFQSGYPGGILDKGSFTAAAGVIGCTPSAVSLQVKQLETYFGKPLFDRSSRP